MAVDGSAIIGLVLLLAVSLLGLFAWRRVRRIRRGGVDVALRTRPDQPASRWHLGVARYHGEEFAWYRSSSLRAGPDTVLRRGELTVVSRSGPAGPEAVPLEAVALRCRGRDGERELELAMTADALTGFLSWLESAPPGRVVPWAS